MLARLMSTTANETDVTSGNQAVVSFRARARCIEVCIADFDADQNWRSFWFDGHIGQRQTTDPHQR